MCLPLGHATTAQHPQIATQLLYLVKGLRSVVVKYLGFTIMLPSVPFLDTIICVQSAKRR